MLGKKFRVLFVFSIDLGRKDFRLQFIQNLKVD